MTGKFNEPLRYREESGEVLDARGNCVFVAYNSTSEAFAKHMLGCVNAVGGIEDPEAFVIRLNKIQNDYMRTIAAEQRIARRVKELEIEHDLALAQINPLHARVKELEAQNAEMLALLRAWVNGGGGRYDNTFEDTKALLAKLDGEKP